MEEALEDLINWDDLPAYLKVKVIGNNQEQVWESMKITFHAENRIRFKNYEKMSFYRDLIRTLRLKLDVFPYHLCRFINFTTPFDYYVEMLCDLLRVQKGYDCLPTFTAADILRVVGIHRNSYTELLQKCKDKGWISKISRAIRSMLPKFPLSVPVEGWWFVFPLLHKKPKKTANKNEVECLSEICKDFTHKSNNPAGKYDKESLEGLYKATVVEFDIEIESYKFELIRDIKNFIPDKSGFGKQIGEVLKLCENSSNFQDIQKSCRIGSEVVKDCLSVLCRLGFLDVQNVNNLDWHRSWLPISDLENSITSSVLPSFDASNSDELIKVTVAVGKDYSQSSVKVLKDLLCKNQLDFIESPKPAIALSLSAMDPVIFSGLTSNESLLYRLFKLKYCGISPILYLTKGYYLTVLPEELTNFQEFILSCETSVKESSITTLLEDLGTISPTSSVFVIPSFSKLQSVFTLPLPLNLLNIKDKQLMNYFREKNLANHFENFVGWLEIAMLADKNFIILDQKHGLNLSSKETTSAILSNLIETSWFKYNNLESVSEAQQDEVFQFREFICGIDLENGCILLP